MLYELRIYDCCPGRLPALLDRFNTITLAIWERHGIRQAGFWTTVIGENNHQLIYLLQWESLAEREEKWTAFQADPELYAPEYGNYCAAAMSQDILAAANPRIWLVEDGELFVFARKRGRAAFLADTAARKQAADTNWPGHRDRLLSAAP